MANQYDVVIIGGGVAGALCAARLAPAAAAANRKILILEAADHAIDGARDFSRQRVEFHRVMNLATSRGDMHAPYSKIANRNLFPAPENTGRSLEEQQLGAEKYYDQVGPQPFRAQYNRLVGGSTLSWRGNVPRFLPADFELKTRYGIAQDWPLTYDDLESFYSEAERELGVSGRDSDWADPMFGTRSAPFPMPEIARSYSDQQMFKAIEGKDVNGTTVRIVHTPQARNSQEYDGRPACEGNHNCIPLCPIQAKYDATVHLKKALAFKDSVKLLTGCVATRLKADANGKVTEVFYKNWKTGSRDKEQSVKAGIVILAANAIETPKLLLLSENMANRSDQVGRNLMDHLQEEVGAWFPKPLYPFRGPQSIASIEVFRDGPFRAERSGFRMTIGNDGFGRKPGFSPQDILEKHLDAGEWGTALVDGFSKELSRMVRISFSTEQLPTASNRVELSDKLDDLGIKRPKISFEVDDYVFNGLDQGRQTAVALFRLINPAIKLMGDEPHEKAWNTAAHIMGTCRMGTDPQTSVVDADGRCHDHSNLYIVGSSVFTTGATANPTMTLAALSLKTAAAIAPQL